MARWNVGEKNGMWKGGRTKTKKGYVLIMVGKRHHLADCRGYAYEHRLVAEKKLGRRLRPGEQVHHDDDNKSNNNPKNLIVAGGAAEHRFWHRKKDNGLRKPGEKNTLLMCACGCKRKFRKYDGSGRPRRFISGHNPQKSPTEDAILKAIRDGAAGRAYISSVSGIPLRSLAVALSKMKRKGMVTQMARGVWGIRKGVRDGRKH